MRERIIRTCCLAIFAAAIATAAVAQQRKFPFPFNEFSLSGNHSVMQVKTSTGLLPGFGLGVTRVMGNHPWVKWTVGLEFYQVTNKGGFHEPGPDGYSTNKLVTKATMGNISIPVTLRISIEPKNRFFVEPGVFLDANMYGRIDGNIVNGQTVLDTYGRSEKFRPLNPGLSLGLGWQCPFEKATLVVRPEFRWGLLMLYQQPDMSFGNLLNTYFRLSIGLRFDRTD